MGWQPSPLLLERADQIFSDEICVIDNPGIGPGSTRRKTAMKFSQKIAYMVSEVVPAMVVLLCLCSASQAQVTQKAAMPTERGAFSAGVVDGKIYLIGGAVISGKPLTTVEAYDPATDAWITRTDMPTARVFLSTSVVDDKIYAIGGEVDSPWRALSTVEMYDPATDTWTTKADMPEPRKDLSTSVVDGRIYAISGGEDTTPHPDVFEYDPATDTWTRKADMPVARGDLSTSVVDGKIYAIGGGPSVDVNNWIGTPTVYAYDPATDTWTRKADMPTARTTHAASVVDGKIYVIGGWSGDSETPLYSTVEVYDPATDSWTTLNGNAPTPSGGVVTCTMNGMIYAMGGVPTRSPYTLSRLVEECDPGLDPGLTTGVGIATWGRIKSLGR